MHTFDFGINWQSFSDQQLDNNRIQLASRSLQALIMRDNLRCMSFLDVGCGSGLFTIAANQLGAKAVGIDINPLCITVSKQNRDRFTPDSPVYFKQISALDIHELINLGQFDIVYAWGSLHHTGEMWNAIHYVSQLVAPDGILVLAIYNKHYTSPIWNGIKWLYNKMPELLQRVMVYFFAGIIFIAKFIVTRHNPLKKERGMSFWYDVIDWLGGYPYEYAHPEIVIDFVTQLGFKLFNFIPSQVPTGCNEFTFKRIK